MAHLVGRTKNGVPVYVDLIKSDAAKHIAAQPYLLTLAAEALRSTNAEGAVVSFECDMGRPIGYDLVVETTSNDSIFYVQLVRDELYTRFTKNSKPAATARLSVVLHRNADGESYNLHGLWVGRFTPPRPGSAEETVDSRTYWEKHAFVFENQPIQLRTLTKTCPY
jgi:hypothetical protein